MNITLTEHRPKMIFPHNPINRKVELSSFKTPNRHGYSVQFAPFAYNCLAVASSQYYGSVGGGTVFILQVTDDGSLIQSHAIEWSDGLFDVAWSEHSDNLLISACGDGGIQLWEIDSNSNDLPSTISGYNKPTSTYYEHTKEVCSICWSSITQNPSFLSSSWDGSIKWWNPEYSQSLQTFTDHSKLVYEIAFAKHLKSVFASVGGDGYLKLWDAALQQPVMSILAHPDSEVLSCSWNEHDRNIIATGGSDGLIKVWDLRNSTIPYCELFGCSYAVRRVRFSPFDSDILASASYDHASRIWNWQQSSEPVETMFHHSEYNYGLNWNRLVRNQLADCGWDSLVQIFSPKCLD